MNFRYGISEDVWQRIATVLARHEVETAVLFGSRAKGTYKTGSDIDLALTGTALDWRAVGRIYQDLDDLLLPYSFSLVCLGETTDGDLAAHIRRIGIPIYRQERVSAETSRQ